MRLHQSLIINIFRRNEHSVHWAIIPPIKYANCPSLPFLGNFPPIYLYIVFSFVRKLSKMEVLMIFWHSTETLSGEILGLKLRLNMLSTKENGIYFYFGKGRPEHAVVNQIEIFFVLPCLFIIQWNLWIADTCRFKKVCPLLRGVCYWEVI